MIIQCTICREELVIPILEHYMEEHPVEYFNYVNLNRKAISKAKKTDLPKRSTV